MMSHLNWLSAIDSPWHRLILNIQDTIQYETTAYYHNLGIRSIMLPVTTGSISSPMGRGSDSKPVTVEIEGRDIYLADSMQFLLEYGCRFFTKGCYYVMPTFRGDDVDERHLKQFFHSEAEIPGHLQDVMELSELYIKHLLRTILNNYRTDIYEISGDVSYIENFIDGEIPRITFDEAEDKLRRSGKQELVKYIEDLGEFRNLTDAGERELIRIHGGAVWVTNYDAIAVPFYQKEVSGKARNADLLMGIGETLGCGERYETTTDVLKSLKKHGVSKDSYRWYVDMRERFPMQTSGFGLGLERLLLFILNHDDIRDVQIFRRFNDGKDVV